MDFPRPLQPDFNPRSPWGERRGSSMPWMRRTYFNPRSPWGERRRCLCACWQGHRISIHAPRGGSDCFCAFILLCIDISIHAPRGGATCLDEACAKKVMISIHAPRGGSDIFSQSVFLLIPNFNPRSPWGERLCSTGFREVREIISIHAPRGGSDHSGIIGGFRGSLISIHAPRGGSDRSLIFPAFWSRISIHAPRGGSDPSFFIYCSSADLFQSTLPVGGATGSGYFFFLTRPNFNPRSPWGERRIIILRLFEMHQFQSTLPVGGATL